ncbi:hypothetical protein [Baaleninema sp.]
MKLPVSRAVLESEITECPRAFPSIGIETQFLSLPPLNTAETERH